MLDAARNRALRFDNMSSTTNSYSCLEVLSALTGKHFASVQVCQLQDSETCGFCYLCKESNGQKNLTALCHRESCALRFNSLIQSRQEDYLRYIFPTALYLSLWDLNQLHILPLDPLIVVYEEQLVIHEARTATEMLRLFKPAAPKVKKSMADQL